LADARTLYADILAWYDWDFAAAEREYLKALALDPNNVLGYVLFLSTQLRHEKAIALIEQRIEANPDDAYAHINAAWIFMRNRQYERAIQEANLAQEHTDVRPALGFAYLGMGEVEQAVDVLETDLQVEGRRPRQLANLAVAYFAAGRESEAQQLLDELTSAAATRYVSPDFFAEVYFAAGDIDKGFAALEQVVEVRSRGAIFLQTNTSLDDHRLDPRYLALIEAVGFQ
jgi:tetratricopeptide (TPR) repeat protein